MHKVLVAVATLVGLVASTAAQAQQKKELIWCAPVMGSSYYWDVLSAVELGYMDQVGLSLKLVNNDTPVQALQFIATGACNIGSITTELAVSAVDKGAGFKFIGSEDDRIAFVMMSRPEINGFDDLRGKTIGVTQLQESTATMIRLLLEKHGVKRDDYNFIALGGTPNRYAALVRGAVSATMLSPPFDYKAEGDGMKRMGNAFDAFDGVGVVFVVADDWAKANAGAVTSFLQAAAKAEKFLYDPSNKQKAVDILVKYTKSPAADIAKSYDSFYGKDRINSPNLELTDRLLQPWLDLRGSAKKPADYIDLTYWTHAVGQ
jgi:ABC-type nitrate/sulfonate/bicarbonate transport system substrate-binding protein